jgi:hypothetical protein
MEELSNEINTHYNAIQKIKDAIKDDVTYHENQIQQHHEAIKRIENIIKDDVVYHNNKIKKLEEKYAEMTYDDGVQVNEDY